MHPTQRCAECLKKLTWSEAADYAGAIHTGACHAPAFRIDLAQISSHVDHKFGAT